MRPCNEDWIDAILDRAAGDAPKQRNDRLSRHLAECESCEALFASLSADAERIDHAIHEIANPGASASFRARVLVEATTAQPTGGKARRWLVAASVAAAAVAMALFFRSSAEGPATLPSPPSSVEVAAWRSPTRTLLRSSSYERFKAPPRLGNFYIDTHDPNSREERR